MTAPQQLSLFDDEPDDGQLALFPPDSLPRFPTGAPPDTAVLRDSAIAPLVAAPAFDRLRRIGFLGAIDYVFHPQRWDGWQRYSRYEHSLAVADLADRFARRRGVEREERRTLVAAALLHDLGHGPLSHSSERAFADLFGIDHHRRTEELVRDRSGPGSIGRLLDESRLSADEVIRLLSGRSNAPAADLFDSPLNVDTLDGIWRARRYACRQILGHPRVTVERLADEAPGRWQTTFDRFWQDKEAVYRHVVGGRIGAMAVDLVDSYVRENASDLTAAEFERDDIGFLRSHPRLARALRNMRRDLREALKAGARLEPEPSLRLRRRSYRIDGEVFIETTSDLYKRYQRGMTAEIISAPLGVRLARSRQPAALLEVSIAT
ncbi:MAG: HD domain-containing protein [Azospirillaceae bacterium]